ncbi:MAG: GvpL/GvpF family gas vesicle protein [Methanophagales archaeon]|nr:GvpL/GvpF family gas vesicle protein [Methanophagales archaeon]
MTEKDKLRGIIAEIVREETEAMMSEANEAIREIVRTDFLPKLRSAVRESITKEFESAAFPPQTAMAKEEAAVAESEIEPTMAREMEAGGVQGSGLYLYGIAEADAQTKLGEIGIEGSEVYTIPYEELSAIVHNCPLEPYKSDDEEVVKGWVKTHQHVLDVAEEKFGTVIPFSLDIIIKPEDNATAEEAMKKWMSDEFNGLMEKMGKIRGKKEYGVQIFYIPSVMSEKIADESEEVRKIKEETKSKPPGAAYMYKQKLETAIKHEMESRMDSYFKDFYGRIKKHVEEIKVEKTKPTDEEDKQMIMNLSSLVTTDKYKELGAELEQIDNTEAFSVRFTGPWPAYSFV